MKTITRLLTPALLLGSALAFAGSHGGHGHHGHHAPAKATEAEHPASVQAFMEVNDRMHEGMMIEFTGNADVDFVRGMIPHHQGAIEMAEVVLKYGEDEAIRQLAEEIISAQKDEIEMMQRWLHERGYH